MNRLRQLVIRYMTRAIDLAAFRDAFIKDFLTTQSTDTAEWQAVLEIESACGDFSEGLLSSEVELKYQMSKAIQPLRPDLVSVAVFVSDFDAQLPGRTASGMNSAGAGISSFLNLAQTDLEFADAQ